MLTFTFAVAEHLLDPARRNAFSQVKLSRVLKTGFNPD